ncbi:MAG: hypothetical protein IT259_05000 [Saprospiraceae bacterium]|nr:hypothetical protein [Saprospiraceae bacterium]
MSRLIYAIFLLAGFLLTQSRCGNNADAAKEGDKVLARVYDRSLYSSELEGVVPPGTPQTDSMLIVSAYVQRWLRDQLLMYEAERNIPKDLNIDKLVRDYRASLVRFNFEQQIIVEKLDSTLNDAELQAYYENNKDQFQLESTILKCLVIKLPSSASQSDMNKLWNSRKPADEERLAAFANQWASLALLDREKWYRLDDVAALLPKGTLNTDNIDSRREGTVSEGDYKYYYRVLEVVRGKEPAPFDYVRDQIANVILHKRKQELLERWKEDLYQKELQRENIKIMQ